MITITIITIIHDFTIHIKFDANVIKKKTVQANFVIERLLKITLLLSFFFFIIIIIFSFVSLNIGLSKH